LGRDQERQCVGLKLSAHGGGVAGKCTIEVVRLDIVEDQKHPLTASAVFRQRAAWEGWGVGSAPLNAETTSGSEHGDVEVPVIGR